MSDENKKSPLSNFLETAQKTAKEVATELGSNLEQLSELAAQSTQQIKESDAFKDVVRSATEAKDQLVEAAHDASRKSRELAATGKEVATFLNNARTLVRDRDAFIRETVHRFESLSGQFDREARLAAIGYIAQAGAGIAEITGTEVAYVRPTDTSEGELRLSTTAGKSARLAVGASSNAYVFAAYGDEKILRGPLKRRGVDVQFLVAALGFFKATAEEVDAETRAGGWLFGLGASFSLGIPILSDFSALELDETVVERIALTPLEVRAFEDVLDSAPDRKTRRNLARAL